MCKKKKDEVNEMEITYKVEAKCNRTSGINVEFKGIGDIDTAFEVADTLEGAFPMVDVTCEQTGEVMYSRYTSVDFFNPAVEYGKAIYLAECDMFF
jgi:hypothetical protein